MLSIFSGLHTPSLLGTTCHLRLQKSSAHRFRGRRLAVMAGSQIKGKTVLVQGASRGIGLEFVRQLADKGNTVVATCREPQKATELAKLKDVTVTQLDVASPEAIQQWAQGLGSHAQHFDYVLNIAGHLGQADIETATAEQMLFDYKVNAIGPLLVVQHLLKAGLIGPPGTVIGNMTSKVGSVADNGSGGNVPYRASKSALNNINKCMAIELADRKITATLLHPGYVRTDMTRGAGFISMQESVSGLIANVLESGKDLNGTWHDFAGKEIPW